MNWLLIAASLGVAAYFVQPKDSPSYVSTHGEYRIVVDPYDGTWRWRIFKADTLVDMREGLDSKKEAHEQALAALEDHQQ